jgi:hypothetical protein
MGADPLSYGYNSVKPVQESEPKSADEPKEWNHRWTQMNTDKRPVSDE